jgi:DNA-binding NarL/FixJ family response regulator
MGTEQTAQSSVRVLVLSDETLFNFGVQNLLSQQEALEILSCEPDAGAVKAQLQAFQPHIVVLNSAQQQGASAPEWIDILRDTPGVRLLGLSLQDSSVCIYRGDTMQVREVADLVRAIVESVA